MDTHPRLQDLIDVPALQALLDSLHVSSGIPSAVIDLEGVVLAGAGWQDLCTKFHRVHPESLQDCIQSDITIAAGITTTGEHAQVTCPRGLTDTATPLIIDGLHLANVFTGQMFTREPDPDFFRQQAARFGFDEAAYLEAFRKVPVIPQGQLDQTLNFITMFTVQLANQGLAHLRALKSREALRQALEFNDQVIQTVQEGVIVYGPDLRYRVWNAFMEDLTGVPAAEVLGRHPLEVFPFLQEVGVMDRLNRVLAGEAVENLEFPYHAERTGRRGWTIDSNVPFRNADGDIIGVLATVTDITERKSAEMALRESYDRLEKVVLTSPGIVCSFRLRPDGSSCIPFGGDRIAAYYGIPEAELGEDAGPWIALAHPDDARGLVDSIAESALGLKPWRHAWRVRHPSRGERWVEGHSMPSREPEGSTLWQGVVTDVSEPKAIEAALRRSEVGLKNAQQVAHVGSWAWDIKSDRLEWSEEMYRIFGISRDTFTGVLSEVVAKSIHPEDREAVERANLSVAQDGRPVPLEYRVILPDGAVRVVWAEAGELLLDGAGRPAVLTGIVQDITERRRAEQENARLQSQLMQSQKMESLGSLAGGVAHDINNVLAAIQSIASLHGKLAKDDPRIRRDMEIIATACQRGGKLTRGLLTFARQELGEEQPIDLNAVVREEVALLARTTLQKVSLDLDLGEDLLQVKGDPAALSHSLMNLCVNAVDAMPGGGTLTLRTRNEAGGTVVLEVADTGTGMPREILAKAMDPFFTTKPQGKGTGLGLSIVYGTVKAHHGRMEIQSEPGRGTRVLMHFPALGGASEAAERAGGLDPMPTQGALHVLLVDDDELIQGSVPAILEYLGHSVTAVLGGEEALGLLQGGLRPDAVILDMNMPGLDGAATLPRLRALCPTVPVLLSTGREDQTARDLMADHPFVSLLSKPFEIDELERRLEAIAKG